MESQEKNWVFALDMPADYPQLLHQNANYQLITSVDHNNRTEYKLTS
ncbi:MAG: hypothetical protein O2966_03180 [Proteobacteria bacterium]|nr:hypothetical protein [Pseudomonadota bacterium]